MMKILKVAIYNIHSLKGKHEINFNRDALANTGLYAITGNTGAGKSTILDAITLALYGQTYRHGISSKSADSEIITRNQKEAHAEVVIEVKNQLYLARWEASFNKNNNINDSKRSIYKFENNGYQIITDKKKEAKELIESIIGLNYEQFTKSVLLAQNNFSAFLKADAKERAEMLSKITGTEIYETISKYVFEKFKTLDNEQKQLESALNKDLIPEEKILQLHQEISEKEKIVIETTQEINEKNIAIQHLEAIQTKKEALKNIATEQAALQEELKSKSTLYQSLEDFLKASHIEKELVSFEYLEHQFIHHSEEIKALNLKNDNTSNEIELNKTKINETSKNLHQLTEELSDKLPDLHESIKLIQSKNLHYESLHRVETEEQSALQEEVKFSEAHARELKNVESLEKEIKNTADEIAELKHYKDWVEHKNAIKQGLTQIKSIAHKNKEISHQDNVKKIAGISTKIDHIINDLSLFLQNLSSKEERHEKLNFQISNSKSSEELIIEKNRLDTEVKQWENLREKSNKYQSLYLNLQKSKHEIELLQSEISEADKKYQEKKEQLKSYLEIVLLHQKIATLEEHRAELIDGEPCPLCGATEHPFATDTKNLQVSDWLHKKNNTEQEVEQLEKNIHQKKEIIIRRTAEQDKDLQLLRQYQIEIQDLQTILDLPAKPKDEEIASKLLLLSNHSNQRSLELREVKSLNDEWNTLAQEIKDLRNICTNKEREKTALEHELNQLQIEEKNSKELFERNHSDIQYQIDTINSTLKDFKDYQLLESYDQIVTYCTGLNQKYEEYTKKETIFINLCEQKKQAQNNLEIIATNLKNNNTSYSKIKSTKEGIVEHIQNIDKTITSLTNKFELKDPQKEEKRLRTKISEYQTELNLLTNKLSELQTSLNETEQRKSEVENQLSDFQEKRNKQKERLETLLLSKGFSDIIAVKHALKLSNHEEIKKEKEQNEQRLNSLNDKYKDHSNLLHILLENPISQLSIEVLMAEQLNNEHKLKDLNQAIGGIKERLNKQEALTKENEAKEKIIAEKQITLQSWKQLCDLIGSSNGASFKNFAQDFTLSLLIQYANRHLEVMFNRYELFKDDQSKEMELQIKDKYFFNQIRTINSLSGGETFIVSLALALGLSDLASKNTKIESLFIDEGFGSLDPESLNNALDALELLRQTDQRQIGIISHIEELKKRIPCQIRVIRTSTEFSKIEVSNN